MPKPEDRMFFSENGIVSAGQFADELPAWRHTLGSASHVCNLHQDRLHFALGLVAALLNTQTTILPPSDAPEAIVASLDGAASPIILGGNAERALIAPRIGASHTKIPLQGTQEVFETLAMSHGQIHVFTSGTTKRPESNLKTWDMLWAGASVTDAILSEIDADPDSIGLLGTTPPRHMFGLEANIFANLGFGRCLYRKTIFYPADLEAAIATSLIWLL